MASNAFAGVGAKFQRWSGTAYVDIAEINSIEGPTMNKDVIEVTSLDTDAGYNEFITGFTEGGTVVLSMNFTRDTYELMKNDFEVDVLRYYAIVLPDYDSEPSTFSFAGLVIELPITMEADDKITADVTIQVSSEVTLDVGSTVPGSEEEEIPIPVFQSAHVDNATPTEIHLIYDLTLSGSYVPDASAFAVVVAGAGATETNVAVSGIQVTVTISAAVTPGQSVTVAYTKPVTNFLRTAAGGEAESFLAQTATNNTSSGFTYPSELDDGHTTGLFVFDQNLVVDGVDVDSWTKVIGTASAFTPQESSAGAAPHLITDGIQFLANNSDNLHCLNTGLTTQPNFIYLVFRQDSWVNGKLVLINGAGTVSLRSYAAEAGIRPYNTGADWGTANYGAVVGSFAIFRMHWNGASSSFWINGNVENTGTQGTNALADVLISGAYGTLAAIIFRDSSDNAATQLAIWNWLAANYAYLPNSIVVNNATPNKIEINFGFNLDIDSAEEPPYTDFHVSGKTVIGITVTANKVTLTTATNFVSGASAYVSYRWEGSSIQRLLAADGHAVSEWDIYWYLTNNVV
jgi:predicted secreted protein